MIKFFIFVSIFFCLSKGIASDELPRPLPDDSYPSDPTPYPEPPPPPPREVQTPYSIGWGETARFGTQNYTFSPRKNLNRVVRVTVVGIRNANEIKSIRIQYADKKGPKDLYQLRGKINPGETRAAILDGRPIKKIEVVAAGSYFWRMSGSFRVDVVAAGDGKARFEEEDREEDDGEENEN